MRITIGVTTFTWFEAGFHNEMPKVTNCGGMGISGFFQSQKQKLLFLKLMWQTHVLAAERALKLLGEESES